MFFMLPAVTSLSTHEIMIFTIIKVVKKSVIVDEGAKSQYSYNFFKQDFCIYMNVIFWKLHKSKHPHMQIQLFSPSIYEFQDQYIFWVVLVFFKVLIRLMVPFSLHIYFIYILYSDHTVRKIHYINAN